MNPAKVLMERLTRGLNDMSVTCQANQQRISNKFDELEKRIEILEGRG